MTTAADIARNLIALWPWAIVAIVFAGIWAALTFPLAVTIGRAFKAGGEEYAEEINGYPVAKWDRLLDAIDLPAPDAPDAAFERWAIDALTVANDHTFDTTLGEIRALPETETA